MSPLTHPCVARRSRCRPAARLPLVTLAALLALPACASRQTEGSNEARVEQEPTTLVVENQSFLDANIYVLRGGGGQRTRLGLAGGNSRSRFTIPASLIFGVTSLQFIADPVGAQRAPVSNEIAVSAGEEVRLVIPPR